MMYIIVLTNGKAIKINADEVEWHGQERMIKFINKCRTIAKINMDNVVGLIEADYIILPESEE